jgi:hypothetical protein
VARCPWDESGGVPTWASSHLATHKTSADFVNEHLNRIGLGQLTSSYSSMDRPWQPNPDASPVYHTHTHTHAHFFMQPQLQRASKRREVKEIPGGDNRHAFTSTNLVWICNSSLPRCSRRTGQPSQDSAGHAVCPSERCKGICVALLSAVASEL